MTEEEKTPPKTAEIGTEETAVSSTGNQPNPETPSASDPLETKMDSLKIEKNGDSAKDEKEEQKSPGSTEDLHDEDDDADDLDDDEIEENPAYIPKKGRYYMHDSRDEGSYDEYESKKSRADGSWSHDRYVERWQIPKSKKQIVAKYGFDIRYGETEEEASHHEPQEEDAVNKEAAPVRERGRGGPRSFRGRGTSRPQETRGENDDREEFEERAGNRRERPMRPSSVRNVRGGRGSFSSTRGRGAPRHFDNAPRNSREDRRDDFDRPAQRENRDGGEDFMENHRRGATRGAVRGFHSQPGRQFTRTISSSNRYERGQRQSTDSKEGENGGGNREHFEERRAPGGYLSNRARGGRGFRGGAGRGQQGEFRGSSGPKRYSGHRNDGGQQPMGAIPPRQFVRNPSDVVFFEPAAAPAIAPQPSPVVYFDPSQQQSRQLPPREKKIIEIRNPN